MCQPIGAKYHPKRLLMMGRSTMENANQTAAMRNRQMSVVPHVGRGMLIGKNNQFFHFVPVGEAPFFMYWEKIRVKSFDIQYF